MSFQSVAFRIAHRALYGAAIPVLTRTGPLEPALLRAYRRVTQRSPHMDTLPLPLQVEGLTLWYDPDRPSFTVRALAFGTHERGTTALMAERVRPGMTVLDVGAHIGFYTLLCARLVGASGRVFAFEPDPDTRAVLERNVAENGVGDRVKVVAIAAGPKASRSTLHRDRVDSGSSSLFPGRTADPDGPEVEVGTLDGWAEAAGWPDVDLVKMDVEGAEPGAVSGMTEVARRNPALSLVVELNGWAAEQTGLGSDALLRALDHAGFTRVSVITDDGVAPVLGARDRDAIARRASWLPVNLFCEQGGNAGPLRAP